jgi:hypothetical protein
LPEIALSGQLVFDGTIPDILSNEGLAPITYTGEAKSIWRFLAFTNWDWDRSRAVDGVYCGVVDELQFFGVYMSGESLVL